MSDPMIEGFEAHLREQPDDLATWSAYADYLTDQGDPRGEFMAVQIALERPDTPTAQRGRLRIREARLMSADERWLGPRLAEILSAPSGLQHSYRRGWVQELGLNSPSELLLKAIVAAPGMRWVLDLAVTGSNSTNIATLARAPFLPVLRRLRLGSDKDKTCPDWIDGAEALVPSAPRLEELTIRLREPGHRDLFSSGLANLRTLTILEARNFPTRALAACPSFGNLRTLHLVPGRFPWERSTPNLRLADLETLANGRHLVGLTELRFSLSDAGNEGIEVLVYSGLLSRLEVLDLSHGTITDAGARFVVSALESRPHRLRVLDLTDNALTAGGIQALEGLGPEVRATRQHAPDSLDFLRRPTRCWR
jgi:uncharacterized protein (TIGR02996 family)